MKNFALLSLVSFCFALISCGTATVSEDSLSVSERGLLSALNEFRQEQGLSPLKASVQLTELAREDAQRRASQGSEYVDHRTKTGYERLLTLSGNGKAGEGLGDSLLGFWKNSPLQRQWLQSSYYGIGVGAAPTASGLETGVVLLGGFSGGGI